MVPPPGDSKAFQVHLGVFEGPFDLLLTLISKHKLDITEIALATVTNEFIAYIRAQGPDWDLGETSEFLVVAATLLDLKAARLLPAGEIDDEEDLALLEARDLLFARLLQYKAYKQVAKQFQDWLATESKRFPRVVGLEEPFAQLLPEVLIGLGPDEFAALAAKALAPKPEPVVSIAHLHVTRVSVREQAAILVERLRHFGGSTFRQLVADCEDTATKVARFLALLELFREQVVNFEQLTPLGELHIRWTGTEDGEVVVHDEFDEAPAIPSQHGPAQPGASAQEHE
ncbi:segregation/condensation protein A [Sporichthya sp.]|uniref:segregation and condensation protein A n=1 Tax=Sporichthya sp. TaxID=65475 RepID=UPI0025F9957A|nr:segregation/condensation protein A [Sporichthya sp.]